MKPTGDSFDWDFAYHGLIGSAHSVSQDDGGTDAVMALRDVVEEVTREKIVTPEKRIGFV